VKQVIGADQVSPNVLAERIEALCEKLDRNVDEMTNLRTQLEALRIDVAVFKARWSLIAAFASLIGGAIVSLAVKFIGG
jgi:hypothetical protein